MNFKDVTFYKSVGLWSKDMFFDEKKEIIFVWRSNVGKSSIMNAIFQKKDLVKTSARPGKTKLANLFKVDNKKYYFTDLPGYWFARLWKEFKEELDWLISWYIEERKQFIKKVVILIDAKLWAQQTDIDMYKYLLGLEMPLTIVLSKADKLSKNEVAKSLKHANEVFFGQEVIPVSSLKKVWLRDIEKSITSCLLK